MSALLTLMMLAVAFSGAATVILIHGIHAGRRALYQLRLDRAARPLRLHRRL